MAIPPAPVVVLEIMSGSTGGPSLAPLIRNVTGIPTIGALPASASVKVAEKPAPSPHGLLVAPVYVTVVSWSTIRTCSEQVDETDESVLLWPRTLIVNVDSGAFASGVSTMFATSPAPAARVFVTVEAVHPAGRPVNVNENVSVASPVFITGIEIVFPSSGVTSTGPPTSSVYGSTSTPGPRTSKYARIELSERRLPIARTATFDPAPSRHVRDIVRCGVLPSAGSHASMLLPP